MRLLACLAALLLAISSLHCEEDPLAEESTVEETILVLVPLFISHQPYGEIAVILDLTNGSVYLNQETIEPVMAKLISDKGMQLFEEFFDENTIIPAGETVSDKWFSMYFEEGDQCIYIDVQPVLMREQKHSLRKRGGYSSETLGGKIRPMPLSGYINLQGGTRFTTSYYKNYTQPKRLSYGNFDWAFNFQDWVLQGFAYFLGSLSEGFNRGNVLLTHDLPNSGMRLSAGMINPFGLSYMATKPLIGINLDHNYKLFTDATVGPVNREELFLNVPSRVEVYIDGLLIKTLDLDAGAHVLDDFPLVDGLNEVQLKIYSPTGDERTVDLSYFYNPHFLAKGVTNFNASIGWLNYNTAKGNQGYFDLPDWPMFSGSYRIGLSPTATVGTYLQATFNDIFTGTEVNLSNQFIKSILDFGVSYTESNGTDYRTRLGFYRTAKSKLPFNWKCVAEYIGPNFTYLGDTASTTQNAKEFSISGSLDAYLWKRCSIGVLAEKARMREGTDSYYIQLNTVFSVGRAFLVKGILRTERKSTGAHEQSGALNFEFMPRYKNFGFKTNYNSQQKTLFSGVTYDTSVGEVGSFHAAAGYSEAPGTKTGEGSINYEGQRVALKANHYLAKTSSTEVNSTVSITGVSGGTALAFAGNSYAISKPIKQSFVIVAPNYYLRNTPILINPSAKGYDAKATYYMPALIELRSYAKNIIHIGSDDLSTGGMIESLSYELNPTYKSGSLIEIGEETSYIVEGRLIDQNGMPVEKQAGLFICEDEGVELVIPFFTDIHGKYQLIGAYEGNYRIRLVSKHYKGAIVELRSEEEVVNFIELGDTVVIKEEIQEEKQWEVVEAEEE